MKIRRIEWALASLVVMLTLIACQRLIALPVEDLIQANEPEVTLVEQAPGSTFPLVPLPTPTMDTSEILSTSPTSTLTPTPTLPVAILASPTATPLAVRMSSPTLTMTPSPTPSVIATPTSTPSPTATSEPTATMTPEVLIQSQPTATSSPSPTPSPTPKVLDTPTRTPIPNLPPTLIVLEFDGRYVETKEDLFAEVSADEEIDVRLRGWDEDGNMAYLALLDADGETLYREDCSTYQGEQCTRVLKVKAPSRDGEVIEFSGVAVDSQDVMSEAVRLTAETRTRRSGGGSGGGGGGGSGSGSSGTNPTPVPTPTATATFTPTPTPTPLPKLVVKDTQGTSGEVVPVEVELQSVSDGLAGFIIDAVVQDPAIARIDGVNFPDYGIQTVSGAPGASVTITIADFNDVLEGVISSAIIATLDVQLLSAGSTTITLNLDQVDSDSGDDLIPFTIIDPGNLDAN